MRRIFRDLFPFNDLKHGKVTYKLGLNTDVLPFNPRGTCSKGGLYFCDESQLHMFCTLYGTKLAIIEIPDDAKVYVEENKFKSDKLIIKEIIDFKDLPDLFWHDIIPKKGLALQFPQEQTEKMCIGAVKQNGLALKYVDNQTDEICMLAVKQDCKAIKYVKNQTQEICDAAIQQDYDILRYAQEQFQTENMCILAVQNNGHALKYVKKQTEEICLLAVNQNKYTLTHVDERFKSICEAAIRDKEILSNNTSCISPLYYFGFVLTVSSALYFCTSRKLI